MNLLMHTKMYIKIAVKNIEKETDYLIIGGNSKY